MKRREYKKLLAKLPKDGIDTIAKTLDLTDRQVYNLLKAGDVQAIEQAAELIKEEENKKNTDKKTTAKILEKIL